MPEIRNEMDANVPGHVPGLLMITVEPEHIAKSMLQRRSSFLFQWHRLNTVRPLPGGVGPETIRSFRSYPPSLPRQRHSRKYAEGDTRETSFLFRGPDEQLNLRAQNLNIFLQIDDGVDDLTWDYHLPYRLRKLVSLGD